MNIFQVQEQQVYKQLMPVFNTHGYHAIPSKKQFRKPTKTGFKNVILTVSGDFEEQLINVQLGIRFDLVEDLVQQFLNTAEAYKKESSTITASINRFKEADIDRLTISSEASLQESCRRIGTFMQHKGFSFLDKYERLKRVDGVINRKPSLACPYMYNQIYRCFKGIAIARILHRTNFEQLVTIYSNYLYSQWAPRSIVENFDRLVNYLRHFSLN